MIDTKKLRELAEAAHKSDPAPWRARGYDVVDRDGDPLIDNRRDECPEFYTRQTAEYIAEANPATILALLDEIERLEEQVEDLEDAVESLDSALGADQ
jgi:hypothetical protein